MVSVPSPELASVDGAIGPGAEAVVPAADDGLRRGDGAFEVIRLYAGRPLALDEHLARLAHSAQAIELAYDDDALRTELQALLHRYGDGDGQLRIILTRGGRRVLFTEPLPVRGATLRLATVRFSTTGILDGVKSLSYAPNQQASRIARHRGADEAVLIRPDGVVLEAPTSSVFWVTPGGRLRTPSLEVGTLASITRSFLMQGLEVEDGVFDVADLLGASEAFLASTTREVQPVAAIDDRSLQAPGPVTERARVRFAELRDAALG